jgi:hypothetical protein
VDDEAAIRLERMHATCPCRDAGLAAPEPIELVEEVRSVEPKARTHRV